MTSASAALIGVDEWLEAIGLSEYRDVFEEEGYDDIAVVAELTEDDLDVLGVTKRGTRKKLLMKAKALRATLSTKDPVKDLVEARRNAAAATDRSPVAHGRTRRRRSHPAMDERSNVVVVAGPAKQASRKSDIIERLTCLLDEDSDGDGDCKRQGEGRDAKEGDSHMVNGCHEELGERRKEKEEDGGDVSNDNKRNDTACAGVMDGTEEHAQQEGDAPGDANCSDPSLDKGTDDQEKRKERVVTNMQEDRSSVPHSPTSQQPPSNVASSEVQSSAAVSSQRRDSRDGEVIEVMEQDGQRQKLLLRDRAFSFHRTMQMWQSAAPLAATTPSVPMRIRSATEGVPLTLPSTATFGSPGIRRSAPSPPRSPSIPPYRSPLPTAYTPIRSLSQSSQQPFPLPPPPPVMTRKLRSVASQAHREASRSSEWLSSRGSSPVIPGRPGLTSDKALVSVEIEERANEPARRSVSSPILSTTTLQSSRAVSQQESLAPSAPIGEATEDAANYPKAGPSDKVALKEVKKRTPVQALRSRSECSQEPSKAASDAVRPTSAPASVAASPQVDSTVVDPLAVEVVGKDSLVQGKKPEKKHKKHKKKKKKKKKQKTPAPTEPSQPTEHQIVGEQQAGDRPCELRPDEEQEEKDRIGNPGGGTAASFDPIPSVSEPLDQAPLLRDQIQKSVQDEDAVEAAVFESKVSELVKRMREALVSNSSRRSDLGSNGRGSISSHSSSGSSQGDPYRSRDQIRDKGKQIASTESDSDSDLNSYDYRSRRRPIPGRSRSHHLASGRSHLLDSTSDDDDEALDEHERRRMRASVAKMRRARRTESAGSDSEAEIERFWRTRSTDADDGRRTRDAIQLLPQYQGKPRSSHQRQPPTQRKPLLLDIDLELLKDERHRRQQLLLDEDGRLQRRSLLPASGKPSGDRKRNSLVTRKLQSRMMFGGAKSSSAVSASARRDANKIGRTARDALLDSTSPTSSTVDASTSGAEDVVASPLGSRRRRHASVLGARQTRQEPEPHHRARSQTVADCRPTTESLLYEDDDDDDSNVELHYAYPHQHRHSSRSARIPSIKYDLAKLQKENEELISRRSAMVEESPEKKKGRHGMLHKLFFASDHREEKEKAKGKRKSKNSKANRGDEDVISGHKEKKARPKKNKKGKEKKLKPRKDGPSPNNTNGDRPAPLSRRHRTISEDLRQREQALVSELRSNEIAEQAPLPVVPAAVLSSPSHDKDKDEELRQMAAEIRKLKEEVAKLAREERPQGSQARLGSPPAPPATVGGGTGSFELADDELDEDDRVIEVMMKRRLHGKTTARGEGDAKRVAANRAPSRPAAGRGKAPPVKWESNLQSVSADGTESEDVPSDADEQPSPPKDKRAGVVSFWF